jgi:hypothetical protein
MGSPTLHLEVSNGTGKVVQRAYFHAQLTSQDRADPWVKAEFNYEIPGGLHPGESAEWDLSPNMFGEWGRAPKDRTDLILTVVPVALEDASGSLFADRRLKESSIKSILRLTEESADPDLQAARATLSDMQQKLSDLHADAVPAMMQEEFRRLEDLKQKVDSLSVTNPAFFFTENQFSTDPIISLTATNSGGHTITRMYAHGQVISPGREVPWVSEDFNFQFDGGLAPGESQDLRLAPNRFGAWGKAPNDRDDLQMTISVVGIDILEGQEESTVRLDAVGAKRLEWLRARILEGQ